MTKEQKLVKDFMVTFGQDCPNKPVQLDEKTAKLRAALILEEAFETITKGLGLQIEIYSGPENFVTIDKEDLKSKGFELSFFKKNEVDLTELADGLADLHYVGYCGTGLAAGIDMEPIFEDVDDSNKSKLWQNKNLNKIPAGFIVTDLNNGFSIVRNDKGKIAKPDTYREANPGKFIDQQLNKDKEQLELI